MRRYGEKAMNKYTTLVFKSDTPESLQTVRDVAQSEHCKAWSMDHEILRLELIEQALDEGDINKAKSYIGEVDVTRFLDRLSV